MMRRALLCWVGIGPLMGAEDTLRTEARAALERAAAFYTERAAAHGGYVYYYSPDLSERWGEGKATMDQIWVQEPGTPRVGRALLRAYAATKNEKLLKAAVRAAEALMHGQLASGGWTNALDFNPKGERVGQYRNGRGRGKNFSTLDDGITPAALRFLMELHEVQGKPKGPLAESIQVAVEAMLAAQFSNGAFPQGWQAAVTAEAEGVARFPPYDWRTEGRIKDYWDLPTLNDNSAGQAAQVLIQAWRLYGDDRCRNALVKLGAFLLAAQLPEPQRAWAQQYNLQMIPVWARAFEPPAVAGRESQEVIGLLMDLAVELREARLLAPIPAALAYLRGSVLPDGRLARYYELESNRPLYMERDGKGYRLTHSDANLPDHYGWKVESHLDELEARYQRIMNRQPEPPTPSPTADEVRKVIAALDPDGRWVSEYDGELIVGQPKWPEGYRHLSSAVFAENLTLLSDYLVSSR